eukprot:m.68479 g.68479  ORF g.68479 m.68479 type:complete len:327 (+) comp7500_c0_seq2:15-995(+)
MAAPWVTRASALLSKALAEARYLIDIPGQGVERLRVFIDRSTGQEELSKLREVIKHKELKYKDVKVEYERAQSAFEAALEAQMKCEKDINVLTSNGGHLSNPKQFYDLATQRAKLNEDFVMFRTRKEAADRLQKESFETFADSIRESYALELQLKDKIRSLAWYCSLIGTFFGMFVPVLFLEPLKVRRLRTFTREIIAESADAASSQTVASLQPALALLAAQEAARQTAATAAVPAVATTPAPTPAPAPAPATKPSPAIPESPSEAEASSSGPETSELDAICGVCEELIVRTTGIQDDLERTTFVLQVTAAGLGFVCAVLLFQSFR